MIKLHGAPLSNYYNMVKTALLEKGVDFEEVLTAPSQTPEYLGMSPMGKIPCIETVGGFLSESGAILDYLEDLHPTPPLLPSDPYARAKARELARYVELYVELAARPGYAALRGKPVADDVKEAMKQNLPKGMAAVSRLATFSPWIQGDDFSYVDLIAYFCFILAVPSARKNLDLDLFAEVPGAQAWYERVGDRPSVKQARADQAAAMKK